MERPHSTTISRSFFLLPSIPNPTSRGSSHASHSICSPAAPALIDKKWVQHPGLWASIHFAGPSGLDRHQAPLPYPARPAHQHPVSPSAGVGRHQLCPPPPTGNLGLLFVATVSVSECHLVPGVVDATLSAPCNCLTGAASFTLYTR